MAASVGSSLLDAWMLSPYSIAVVSRPCHAKPAGRLVSEQDLGVTSPGGSFVSQQFLSSIVSLVLSVAFHISHLVLNFVCCFAVVGPKYIDTFILILHLGAVYCIQLFLSRTHL